MIQRLRKKFILLSVSALLVVIITLVGGLSVISSYRTHQQVNNVLTILSKNHDRLNSEDTKEEFQQRLGPNFNREGIYQYRYFTVTITDNGKVKEIDDSHIMTVPRSSITQIAKRVNNREKGEGTIRYNKSIYAYRSVYLPNRDKAITFLDASIILDASNEVIKSGLYLGGFSLILFAMILALLSRRAIKPIVEAEQRQKEFITNAGHELKTPISVISANNELAEMMGGETEWTKSNKQQITRLTDLINHLIALARFQEEAKINLEPTNISKIIDEACESFKSVIINDKKTFSATVAPNMSIKANQNYFYELISILLDNANKYCDPGGHVSLKLRKSVYKRVAVIEISNTYANGKNVDYHKFFERFYRNDKSHHHGKKNGFGIGLSMAQSLVQSFNGKIDARYQSGCTLITLRFKLI